jgi:hypothetical protein
MKKSKQTIFSIVFLLIVHIVLCDIYNFTYFSDSFDFAGKFTGVVYWAILIGTFLAGPFVYYVAGRLRKNKGDKKLTLALAFSINVLVTIFGVASFFNEQWLDFYRIINAPSYLYYSLFSGTVMYVAVPAMIISSIFPAFFFKIGYLNKPRTNNEITMEEVEKKGKEEKTL